MSKRKLIINREHFNFKLNCDSAALQMTQPSPVHKVAVKRTWDGPDSILKKAEPIGEVVTAGAGGAHDDVCVAVHVLGQAVHHDVSPEFQGPLEVAREKGVVHNKENVRMLLGNLSNSLDVDNFQCWVGGTLHPHHLSVWSNGGFNILGICSIYKARLNVHPCSHLPEVSVSSSVKVIHRDNVVSGTQEVGDGGGCCQAAGEDAGVLGTVQRGQTSLQYASGRVSAAAVLVHLEVSGGVLLKGGGHGDRGHHGHGGPLLGLLTNMERLGGKMGIILSERSHPCSE